MAPVPVDSTCSDSWPGAGWLAMVTSGLVPKPPLTVTPDTDSATPDAVDAEPEAEDEPDAAGELLLPDEPEEPEEHAATRASGRASEASRRREREGTNIPNRVIMSVNKPVQPNSAAPLLLPPRRGRVVAMAEAAP